jgi:hypothetical protein
VEAVESESRPSGAHQYIDLSEPWGVKLVKEFIRDVKNSGNTGEEVPMASWISMDAAGSSGTNANLPPYVGMLPVIKY